VTEPTPESQPPQNPAPSGPPPQYGLGGYPAYPPPGYPQPYPQAPYAYQPPKKRPVWPWVLGGIFVVVFLCIGACVAFVGGVASNIDKETKREVEVIYAVSGSGRSVAITYSGRDFNTAQETAVRLPWNRMRATNDMSGGTITCQITANGKTIAEQSSTGPFATASCVGNAGAA
jgi:hypothetical protein